MLNVCSFRRETVWDIMQKASSRNGSQSGSLVQCKKELETGGIRSHPSVLCICSSAETCLGLGSLPRKRRFILNRRIVLCYFIHTLGHSALSKFFGATGPTGSKGM